MPRLDKTGPQGTGPIGGGRGWGRGFGRGCRGGGPLAPAEDEIAAIEREIAVLQERLDALRQSQSGKE